jgi:hypothetical protein
MTSRERFRAIMNYGFVDRVPYFEEGIRPEVLRVWRRQGMSADQERRGLLTADPRIELELDLDPHPSVGRWPVRREDLADFRHRLDPEDPRRLPRSRRPPPGVAAQDAAVRMLRVHRGLFLSMGVKGWDRFREVMLLLGRDRDFVREAMQVQGEFNAALLERFLSADDIDAAIFSEPIGGNDRPLISPDMYADVVLDSYRPVMTVLRRFGVATIIFRTYGNARILLPRILDHGFNCLWACEVNSRAMDYRALRREFGQELRLIGGIDLDALRRGRRAIAREIRSRLPPLLADGGYVPLADGRVREDVSYKNYVYYRKLLREVTR